MKLQKPTREHDLRITLDSSFNDDHYLFWIEERLCMYISTGRDEPGLLRSFVWDSVAKRLLCYDRPSKSRSGKDWFEWMSSEEAGKDNLNDFIIIVKDRFLRYMDELEVEKILLGQNEL